MSANQSYREMQDNVLALVSKSDATTRNRIKNWLNLGQYDFVLRELWPFRETTGTLNLTPGTQEYNLFNNFVDIDDQNILSVTIQGTAPSKLIYWPFNQLRSDQPDFDTMGSSIPTRYYLRAGNMGFWPMPASAYEVLLDYYLIPPEMEDDTDRPLVPVAYREALVQYALSMEHDFNTDPDLAQKAMNRYEQIVSLARQNLLSQPGDTEAFRILGPADFKNWTS